MIGLMLGALLTQASIAVPAILVTTVNGWQIHDGRGTCTASTTFEGGTDVFLRYDSSRDIATLMLSNRAWESVREDARYGLRVDFSNDRYYTDPAAQGFVSDSPSWRLPGILTSFDGTAFVADVAVAASMTLTLEGRRLGGFRLNGTRAVMMRLVRCSVATRRRYPIDPFADLPPRPVATAPIGPGRLLPAQRAQANLTSYFTADDYPAAALRGNEQGVTGFALTIGANGRVEACSVTSSSGSAALDQATCRILRSRARYTPARDNSGNPTIGRDSGAVTWRLPTPPPPIELPQVQPAP